MRLLSALPLESAYSCWKLCPTPPPTEETTTPCPTHLPRTAASQGHVSPLTSLAVPSPEATIMSTGLVCFTLNRILSQLFSLISFFKMINFLLLLPKPLEDVSTRQPSRQVGSMMSMQPDPKHGLRIPTLGPKCPTQHNESKAWVGSAKQTHAAVPSISCLPLSLLSLRQIKGGWGMKACLLFLLR